MGIWSIFWLLSLLSFPVLSVTRRISKRKASDGKFYVLADREGCVSVKSLEPCPLPVNTTLSRYSAKRYQHETKIVDSLIKLFESTEGITKECQNDLKTALCSEYTPKCSDNGTQDYGDFRSECKKFYLSCPESVTNDYKKEKFCETLLTGNIDHNCVTPPRSVKGICPQPKYKMPLDVFTTYEKDSETLSESFEFFDTFKVDGKLLFPTDCISKLKDISCVPVYCSADEKRLLVKHDRDDCTSAVKECMDKPFATLLKLITDQKAIAGINQFRTTLHEACQIYPNATSVQTEARPPTVQPLVNAADRHLQPLQLMLSVFVFLKLVV